MNANPILLQKKYARIIERYSKKYGVSLEQALDYFYTSELYRQIATGVSELHCMSDDYLAEELNAEKTKAQ